MKIDKYRKVAIVSYILVLIVYGSLVFYFPNPADDLSIKESINSFATFNVYESEVIQNILVILIASLGISFLITAWKNLKISLYLCVVLNTLLIAFGFFGESAIYVDYKFDDDLYKILGLLEGFICSCIFIDVNNRESEKISEQL